MVAFISYSRQDAEIAHLLRQDIERAKRPVWIDGELDGGQEWWDTILGQIRGCSLFVFALSPDSLRSKPCMAELSYALALGRPLLPVMVRDTNVQLAPPEIGNAQIVDYRQRNADTAFALVNALAAAPPAPELPTPLPLAPLVPTTYMNKYREQVESESLSYHDQATLYVELRGLVQDEDRGDAAVRLLRGLRQRRDIVESVGKDIDTLLANMPAPAEEVVTPPIPRTPKTPAGWYPDTTGRFDQRYWDGTGWTDNVVRNGQQFRDLPEVPPAETRTPRAVNPADQPFDTGIFVLLLLTSIFCTLGIVGVIAGLMNLSKPARNSQAKILLWVGLAVMALSFLWVIAEVVNNSQSSSF
jgi:hypothetical protein